MPTVQKKRVELLRDDLIITGDIPGGGSTPSGTGYAHVTAGAFDSPATSPIPQADVATLVTDLAAKLVKANNLSDLVTPATARTNLGLGTSATKDVGVIAGTVAAGDDSRLSDSRTPLAHHVSHENGGSDEINVGGLNGVLADPQPPIIGSGATQAVAGNDSRLTDSRTPLAHKVSHQASGSDELSLVGMHGLLADSQTPLAHKTSHQTAGSDELSVTSLFGLLGDPQPIKYSITANVTLLANYCMVVVRKYALADGIKLKLGDGAIFRMI